jgi:hypothetical protein
MTYVKEMDQTNQAKKDAEKRALYFKGHISPLERRGCQQRSLARPSTSLFGLGETF